MSGYEKGASKRLGHLRRVLHYYRGQDVLTRTASQGKEADL